MIGERNRYEREMSRTFRVLYERKSIKQKSAKITAKYWVTILTKPVKLMMFTSLTDLIHGIV